MSKKEVVDQVIIRLIRSEAVEDQVALQKMLQEKDIVISQATLSRLMKKMGIIKQAGRYILFEQENRPVFKILSIESNDSGLVIVRTSPGQAQAVAAFFDDQYHDSKHFLHDLFLGSIAGDDTILVVVSLARDVQKFIDVVKKDFLI